jgi:pilus assembly protein CpaB
MLYLKAREADIIEALKPKSPPIAVVVASRDLVKGDRLDANSLSVREIPSDFVDPNAITPNDFENIEGEVLIQNLASGKPLLRSFIDREFPKDFSDTLALKRRAMTIQIDEVNSFSGLLRPGNRVDILVKTAPAKKTDGSVSEDGDRILPVLENVEVIATGRDSAHDYEEKVRLLRIGYEVQPEQSFTTITLNVTPREAALLSIAKEKGDFIALLRNRKDLGGSGLTGITRNTLDDNVRAMAQESRQRDQLSQVDGNILRGADGLLRTKDGQVLADQDLVLTEDGRLMTKDGVDLSGAGLSLDSQGRLVTADGRVVDPATIKRLPDGSLITTDGVILSGGQARPLGKVTALPDGTLVTEDGQIISGARLNADGKLVLADGRVVDPADVILGADGRLMTKDGKPLEGVALGQATGGLSLDARGNLVTGDGQIISGARLNADGKLVLADGRVVDPADLVITPDGRIFTKDGKPLPELKAGRPMGALQLDANGNVVTEEGVVIKGARLTKDGKLMLADGSVVDPQDLVINADGSIGRQAQLQLEGAKVRADGKWELADGSVIDPKDVIVHADGSVTNRDGKPLPGVKARPAAVDASRVTQAWVEGAKVRADGKWELADGTVVDPKDVIVHADGSVTTKDGKPLEGVKVKLPAVEGAKVRADGKWELADGTVVDPKDVIVHADGSVTTKDGKPLAGVRVQVDAAAAAQVLPGLGADFSQARATSRTGVGARYEIEVIVGGESTEGQTKLLRVPVVQP